MLQVLDYDINVPVAYRFLRRLARVSVWMFLSHTHADSLSLSLAHSLTLSPPPSLSLSGCVSVHGDTHDGTLHRRTLITRLPVHGRQTFSHSSCLHVPCPQNEKTWRMGEWRKAEVSMSICLCVSVCVTLCPSVCLSISLPPSLPPSRLLQYSTTLATL